MSPHKNTFIFLFLISTVSVYGVQKSETPIDTNIMCGPHCLWFAAQALDTPVTLRQLRYFAETDAFKGTSLKGMLRALRKIGLYPFVIQTDWQGLYQINKPRILLFKEDSIGHYVYLSKMRADSIEVIDAPYIHNISQKEFKEVFTGYAIIVCSNNNTMQKLKKEITQNSSIAFMKNFPLWIATFIFIIVVYMLYRKRIWKSV